MNLDQTLEDYLRATVPSVLGELTGRILQDFVVRNRPEGPLGEWVASTFKDMVAMYGATVAARKIDLILSSLDDDKKIEVASLREMHGRALTGLVNALQSEEAESLESARKFAASMKIALQQGLILISDIIREGP